MLTIMIIVALAGIVYSSSSRSYKNIEVGSTTEEKIMITETAFFLMQLQ